MNDFTVAPAELYAAAGAFDGVRNKATQTASRVQAIALVETDFGRVNFARTQIWEAYSGHSTSCLESLGDLNEALASFSEGLVASADAYQDLEDAASEIIGTLTKQIYSGPA